MAGRGGDDRSRREERRGRVRLAPHPLAAPAVGLLFGITAAHFLSPPAWPLLAVAALPLAWTIRQGLWRGCLPPLWLGLGLCLLGAGLLSLGRQQPPAVDHVRFLADNLPRLVVADLVCAPQPTANGRRLFLEARSVDGRPASGLVQLGLPEMTEAPPVGSRLSARLKLRPIVSFANPGGFDYAEHLGRQGIWVQAYAGQQSELKVVGRGDLDAFHLAVERLRQRLGGLFDRLDPGAARGLIRALVLGQLGELSAPVREAFSATGTAHLLAISGMNLAVVWGWAYLVMRWGLALWPGLALAVPLPKLASALALIPTAAYAFIGGASTPTLRALVMAVCLVLAMLLNRPAQAAGGLALAVLVIGLLWPEAPLTLSFQLSFLAVAVIIWAALPLARRLGALWGRSRLLAGAAGLFVLTLVVEVALWPLTALHFHQIPWLGLPANLVMAPLVGTLAQAMALLGSLTGLVWERGGAWLLGLAVWPAEAGIWTVTALAELPWASSQVAGPGPLVVALLYAALAAGLALPSPWRWSLAGALGAASLALGAAQALPPAPDGRLTVWVLDVGQGSAAVARLPQGQVMLIDGGGGLGGLDTGQRVVAPFLWSQGLQRVGYVVASHRHPDHAGGLPFIARWFDPREIWINGAPMEEGPFARLLEVARLRGVPVLGPAQLKPESELGGARVRVLWPPAGEEAARLSENDRSLWLGLGLGRTWVWLPGDGGPRVEKAVLKDLPRQGEQFLLAPHHAGKNSAGNELLAVLKPRALAISCGCVNSFGMPRADTLARAEEAGAEIYQTARQGCLKLVSDGSKWRVEPYLSPPRECPLP